MPVLDRIRKKMHPLRLSLELVDEFADYVAVNSSARNGKNYRQRLKSFLEGNEGRPVAEVRPSDADRWALALRERGLTDATRYAYIQSLRRFERFLRERYPEDVGRKPFSLHLKPPKVHPDSADKIPPTSHIYGLMAMAEQFLVSSDVHDVRDAALFMWILETGCRRNEVAEQQIRHLGLDSPQAIRHADGRISYVYEAVVSRAKTQGVTGMQTVDYTEDMARVLMRWLSARPETDREGNRHDHLFTAIGECGRHRKGIPSSCPICRHHGRPISGEGVRASLTRLAEYADVPYVAPHRIRHWFGQRVLDRTNLEIARQRLRHADIRLTARIYGHQDRRRRKAGAVASSVLAEYNDATAQFAERVTSEPDSS